MSSFQLYGKTHQIRAKILSASSIRQDEAEGDCFSARCATDFEGLEPESLRVGASGDISSIDIGTRFER